MLFDIVLFVFFASLTVAMGIVGAFNLMNESLFDPVMAIIVFVWIALTIIEYFFGDDKKDKSEELKMLRQFENTAIIFLPTGESIECDVQELKSINNGEQYEIVCNGMRYVVVRDNIHFRLNDYKPF